ncbi:hypothetical protein F2P56_012413 [Juglans regia]|uniref:Fungal lipase-type domain-containing protein n=2 Tax=Juglans regia TaxID=51240 RepID=A0A833XMC5_JUGRE|nr:triacylglycerol lipase OBL1-like [Juglans regia]KAF5468247.1 hypothetical protein F2P56_012413 [Juglans regia]
MTTDHSDYVLLKAEEASFRDLVRFLLFPSKSTLRAITFIESSKPVEHVDIWQRWYICVSTFLQKLIIIFGTPMALSGELLEWWLNLLSSNGGVFKLWLKIIKGDKVVVPKKSSATFASVVGHLDQRVTLDKNIKPTDKKYKKSLSMMACKLSYENEAFVQTIVKNQWEMENLGFYQFHNAYVEGASTQAIMFKDTSSNPNLIMVAFTGTKPFDPFGWQTDLDLSLLTLEGVGNIHSGFMKALGLQKADEGWPKEIKQAIGDQRQFAYYAIRQRLREILKKNEGAKFILTGHSLGGALAILFVTVLAKHEEAWLLERLAGVYTFGQPRVGNKQLGEYMKEKMKKYDVKYFRYVYSNDLVPRVPYDNGHSFQHFQTCRYYSSCYQELWFEKEPNENYFSLLWAIPKYLNAFWELIRSFIIPCIWGPDYSETLLMRMFRVIGLIIPGVPAHLTQDYVNATRLGPKM